jgi:hypothetical protein
VFWGYIKMKQREIFYGVLKDKKKGMNTKQGRYARYESRNTTRNVSQVEDTLIQT